MSSKQLIVAITGANRGIGLALARTYLQRGDRVVAACRLPAKSPELQALKETYKDDIFLARMDVNIDLSVQTAAEDLAAHLPRLDVLINNAGIAPGRGTDGLEAIEFGHLRDAFETNAIGPLRTTRALLALLGKSSAARVINISSGAGSVSRKANETFTYAYSASKAALNMLTRIMAGEFKERGICVLAMTPGWVRTDMGGGEAELDPEEVSREIATAIDGLGIDQTGEWVDRRGLPSEYAW